MYRGYRLALQGIAIFLKDAEGLLSNGFVRYVRMAWNASQFVQATLQSVHCGRGRGVSDETASN